MSDPKPNTSRRAFIQSKLKILSFSREHQMVGIAEIIGLAGGVLMVLLVVISYVYFLIPANFRLEALQSERSRLQDLLRDSKEVVLRDESTEATVQKITQSLDDFENNHLLMADRGRMALYENLNALIRKNGVRNTSGPTYAALESSENKKTGGSKTVNTKWQSIYPGIAIGVTLEGSYQNLRHFIRDLEATRQFIIINSVELERSNENTSQAVSAESSPDGGKSALVSLRMEMATYFQRSSPETVENPGTH
jgi:Tfp pilus assembly protein PilO